MDKILYNDNLKLFLYENGKTEEYSCDFHDEYLDRAVRAAQSVEWKTQGFGARFRGDAYAEIQQEKLTDNSYYNSLSFDAEGKKILYSVTVNELSAMIGKIPDHNKNNETSFIHARDLVFLGCSPSRDGQKICTCVKQNYYNSHLAEFDLRTNDYATLTDGDCADCHAKYSVANDRVILFDTKGAGRNGDGDFVRFSPASLCSYDVDSYEMTELLASSDRSYEKPSDDAEGNLYYIEKPLREKSGDSVGRTLLNILLIPWRLLQAIYFFLESFTTVFTGKGFSHHGDSNPAKRQDKKPQEILIEGNLVNADREYKNNLRHKDAFAGYAPRSWVLKKKAPDGTVTDLCRGVIDYTVLSDGSVVCTNGKHVIRIDEKGRCEKIASATLCTFVASYPVQDTL